MYDSVTHSCVDQKREPMNKAGQETFTPKLSNMFGTIQSLRVSGAKAFSAIARA